MKRFAYLGLGSNLGDRAAFLQEAVAGLPDVAGVSAIYETAPVGGPEQGPYLNCVAQLLTDLTPRQLLQLCQESEKAAQRVRDERWGPRTLDVDLLWVDGEEVNEPDLVVPHPWMHQRAFVLIPFCDVAPEVVASLPGAAEVMAADAAQVVAIGPVNP